MERQALSFKIDETEQSDLIERIEWIQQQMTNPINSKAMCYLDNIFDHYVYCGQLLCGVRPYQWDQWDFQKAVK